MKRMFRSPIPSFARRVASSSAKREIRVVPARGFDRRSPPPRSSQLKALKSKVEQGEKEREVLKEELARSKSSTLKESETLKSTSDALSSLRAEHASTLQSLSSLKSKHDGVAKENEEVSLGIKLKQHLTAL